MYQGVEDGEEKGMLIYVWIQFFQPAYISICNSKDFSVFFFKDHILYCQCSLCYLNLETEINASTH